MYITLVTTLQGSEVLILHIADGRGELTQQLVVLMIGRKIWTAGDPDLQLNLVATALHQLFKVVW